MAIYLMNSLPNSLWSHKAVVRQFGKEKISEFLMKHSSFVSAVGHDSTAALYSEVLGVEVVRNRIQVTPRMSDVIIAGLFTPSRRLKEGEIYSEEEILQMPINWVVVNFD